jgi:hypothetical protein
MKLGSRGLEVSRSAPDNDFNKVVKNVASFVCGVPVLPTMNRRYDTLVHVIEGADAVMPGLKFYTTNSPDPA